MNLDDELMRAVKMRAAESGRTMTELVEDALREMLRPTPSGEEPYRLDLPTVSGEALPGVDVNDRDSLHEAMEKQA